jgi:hypothetical protein
MLLCSTPLFAIDTSHEEIFKQLTAVSKTGDPEAQYHLGMMYHVGIGTERDYVAAYRLFETSAQAGHPLSAYKIGCYYAGQGGDLVEADHTLALKYKLIAAEAGYSLAQYDVSLLYSNMGEDATALDWLSRAANQGYSDALLMQSFKYNVGLGIARNPKLAFVYFRLGMRARQQSLNGEAVEILQLLESEMSSDELQEANEMVLDFTPHPSELTLKASSGIEAAITYLEAAGD